MKKQQQSTHLQILVGRVATVCETLQFFICFCFFLYLSAVSIPSSKLGIDAKHLQHWLFSFDVNFIFFFFICFFNLVFTPHATSRAWHGQWLSCVTLESKVLRDIKAERWRWLSAVGGSTSNTFEKPICTAAFFHLISRNRGCVFK